MDSDNESWISGGDFHQPLNIQEQLPNPNIRHNLEEWDDEGVAGEWYSDFMDRLSNLWMNDIRNEVGGNMWVVEGFLDDIQQQLPIIDTAETVAELIGRLNMIQLQGIQDEYEQHAVNVINDYVDVDDYNTDSDVDDDMSVEENVD